MRMDYSDEEEVNTKYGTLLCTQWTKYMLLKSSHHIGFSIDLVQFLMLAAYMYNMVQKKYAILKNKQLLKFGS